MTPMPIGNGNINQCNRQQQKTNGGKHSSRRERERGNHQIAINIEILRRPKQAVRVIEKPRQEICAPLKWLCFLINFAIFLASISCLALGLYLFVNDPRSVSEAADFLLNPSVLLTVIGLISGIVSILGLFGALRDNVFLLKLFALCVFLAYLLLVVCTCLLFLLFYSDATNDSKGISAQSLLHHAIHRYHANRNIADFIDYLQELLECCGSTSFRDWQLSEQFNCNSSNPYPEHCGVPYSCCRRSVVSGAGVAGQNPLAPPIRSLQCWQNAQKKREQQLDSDIYVAGCIQPLRALFDAHALNIGIAVVTVILPVCISVSLSQCLARQIDYQHLLLNREQRRNDRRMHKERHYREQSNSEQQKQAKHKKNKKESTKRSVEQHKPSNGQTTLSQQIQPTVTALERQINGNTKPSPPNVPPPPTPRRDDAEAEMAIKANKREWIMQKQKRHRIVSNRATSLSSLRNIIVQKDMGNMTTRDSMTMDEHRNNMGTRNNLSSTAIARKEIKKGKSRDDQQQQNIKRGKQRIKEKSKRSASSPKPADFIASRLEPSAPPAVAAYLTLQLQQHHFS